MGFSTNTRVGESYMLKAVIILVLQLVKLMETPIESFLHNTIMFSKCQRTKSGNHIKHITQIPNPISPHQWCPKIKQAKM